MKINIRPQWKKKKGYTYYTRTYCEEDGLQIIKGIRLPKKDYNIKNNRIITNDIRKAKSIDRLIRKHLK